jgi:hypothetical protein
MNPVLRFDAAIARYATTQVSKATMKDFMPWPREEDPEPVAPEVVLAYLTASMKKKD